MISFKFRRDGLALKPIPLLNSIEGKRIRFVRAPEPQAWLADVGREGSSKRGLRELNQEQSRAELLVGLALETVRSPHPYLLSFV